MKMKRMLIVLLAGLPLGIYGQATTPLWTQEVYREHNYPKEEWYTGFVFDKLKAGDEIGKALKALEQGAQNQLAESIIVKITGATKVEHTSIQSGKDQHEQITTDYRQAVQTATIATTVKSEVKSHCEPSSGTIYAFAAVRRADLSAFYQKQIEMELVKIETEVGIANQLATTGKKMSAARKCQETKQFFDEITRYQDLLVAIDFKVDANAMHTESVREMQMKINRLLTDLEQSILVYVDCQYEYKGHKDDAFSSDPGIICDIVKQALSENGCSVVDDDSGADHILTLVAYTAQRSDGTGPYGIISYYDNVKGTLYNRHTNRKTADFSILNDPDAYATGKDAETAAAKAFKLPALKDKILKNILPKLKD
jgi:hypothetical protein